MREPLHPETLISAFYDAALDPRLWGSIAEQVAAALGRASAAIHVRTRDSIRVLSRTANFTDRDEAAYRAHYFAKDVLVERALVRGMNQILSDDQLIPTPAWFETEIYRDYLAPLGVHHLTGGLVGLPGETIGVLSVHEDRPGRLFSADDNAFLTGLLPHIRNALRVHDALNVASLERQAMKDFLDRSVTGLLVTDRAGRLLMANARGEALLARSLALTTVAGRITARHMPAQVRLMKLIEAAVDTATGRGNGAGAGCMLSLPADHQPALSITVLPLRPQRDGVGLPDPAALILIRDPAERVDAAQMLHGLYGLTRSEALLANGLVNGLSIDEIAYAHNVTRNTVRTQLKSVLTKTGTSRQTELVALILRSLGGHI